MRILFRRSGFNVLVTVAVLTFGAGHQVAVRENNAYNNAVRLSLRVPF